jgi:hypothetical protein
MEAYAAGLEWLEGLMVVVLDVMGLTLDVADAEAEAEAEEAGLAWSRTLACTS